METKNQRLLLRIICSKYFTTTSEFQHWRVKKRLLSPPFDLSGTQFLQLPRVFSLQKITLDNVRQSLDHLPSRRSVYPRISGKKKALVRKSNFALISSREWTAIHRLSSPRNEMKRHQIYTRGSDFARVRTSDSFSSRDCSQSFEERIDRTCCCRPVDK